MPIRLYQYQLPSRCPFCPVRKGLILEWNEGWGEIAPLPSFSSETFEKAQAEILSLLPYLSTATPRLPSVQFGISCAARPFSREKLKVPLCALEFPQEGNALLKLKVGHLPLPEAIALVKEYAGKFRLRVDCNRAWTLEEGLEFASHFSASDFDYLEEPMQKSADLAHFSEKSGFPLALDESFREEGIAKVPTLKVLVVKPTLSGGIPLVPSSLQIVLSSSYESSLGILQIARLAKEGTSPLGLDTFSEDLLSPPLRAEKGFLLWSGGCVETKKLELIASR